MEYLGGGSALDLTKSGKLEEQHIAVILREILKVTVYFGFECYSISEGIEKSVAIRSVSMSQSQRITIFYEIYVT